MQFKFTQFCAVLALLILLPSLVAARADDSAGPLDVEGDLTLPRFRTVYAPTDRIRELGRGYLPMRREEFERLLAKIQAVAETPVAARARIERAVYAARLQANELAGGVARLQVHHAGEGWGSIDLAKMNLALRQSQWQPAKPSRTGEEPAASEASEVKTALLGAAADRGARLFVSEPGVAHWQWSLAGRAGGANEVEFTFHLPPSAHSQLVLDLPAGFAPLAPEIVVRQLAPPAPPAAGAADTAAEDAFLSETLAAAAPLRRNHRRFLLELGSRSTVAVRVVSASARAANRQPLAFRQHNTYELTRQGLALGVELRLDATHDSLRALVVRLDRSLQLTAASTANQSVAWRLLPDEPQAEAEANGAQHNSLGGRANRFLLEWDEPLRGADRVLRLSALGPLETTPAGALPRLEVMDAAWQEGTTTLRIMQPLALESMRLDECRQESVEPLPAPARGDQLRLQNFSPAAGVTLQFGARGERIEGMSVTRVQLAAAATLGRAWGRFEAARGERYQLSGDVPPSWIIDNVETLPAEALDDWSMEPGQNGMQRLRLRLKQPLAVNRGVEVVIDGHGRRAVPGLGLELDQLRMVRFDDVAAGDEILAVAAEEPYRLRPVGDDDLERLPIASLPSELNETLGLAENDFAFRVDSGAAALRIALSAEGPRFFAQNEVELSLQGETAQETFRARIEPRESNVSRFLVHIAPARGAPMTWSVVGEPGLSLSARALTESEQAAAGLSSLGETWELSLPAPRGRTFVVTAARTLPLAFPFNAALAAVPEAMSQRGQLTVEWSRDRRLDVEHERLRSIATRPPPTHLLGNTQRAFVYDPTRDTLVANEPAARVVETASTVELARAWIWECAVESQFPETGNARHVARLQVELAGAAHLDIDLPDDALFERALVDGVEVPVAVGSWRKAEVIQGIQSPFAVALPPGKRRVEVTLEFITRRHFRRLGDWPRLTATAVERIHPPEIGFKIPVLESRWQVSIPASWQAWDVGTGLRREPAGGDEADASQAIAAATLGDRLLGPLQYKVWAADGSAWQWLSWPAWLGNVQAEPNVRNTRDGGIAARSAPDAALAAPPRGWTTWEFRRENNRRAAAGVAVYHRATLLAWAWLAFALACGATLWVLRAAPAWAAWGWLFLALAVLVPTPYVAPANAILLGWLAALAAWSLRPRWSLASEPRTATHAAGSTATRLQTASGSAIALIIAAGFVLSQTAARGNEAAEAKPTRESETKPIVFVPIDDDLQPTGQYVYLPRAFYDQLHRAAGAAEGLPPAWIAERASYRLNLEQPADGDSLHATEFLATIEFETLEAETTVALPLYVDGMSLHSTGAKLDGKTIRARVVASNGAGEAAAQALVQFDVETPGRHRLELPFAAGDRDGAEVRGERLTLRLPPIPQAQLIVARAENWPAPAVEDRFGELAASHEEESTTRVELGAATSVTVRLPAHETAVANAADASVEPLYWLHVRPGSVTVDGRLLINVDQGSLSRLELAFDPRLRLLALPEQGRFTQRTSAERPGEAILEIDPPLTDSAALDVRFLLAEASGVGHLQLPWIEPRGPRSSTPLWAVSVDGSLAYELSAALDEANVAVPQFLTAWGGGAERGAGAAPAVPQAAFRQGAAGTPRILRTVPQGVRVAAAPSLAVAYRSDRARVRYAAELNVTSGHAFHYRLLIPQNMRVASVLVEGTESTQSPRWTQAAADWESVPEHAPRGARRGAGRRARQGAAADPPLNQLQLFLREPLTGKHRLIVEGEIRHAADSQVALPRLELLDADLAPTRIDVYRDASALVELVESEGLQREANAPLGAHREAWGRLVFRGAAEAGDYRATFACQVNEPRVTGTLITLLTRSETGWQAELIGQGAVLAGALDRLRFDVPAEFSPAVVGDANYTIELSENPRAALDDGLSRPTQRITLRPAAAISDEFQFHLRGAVVAPAGQRMRAPEVTPLSLDGVARYVVVQNEFEGQPLAWEARGLRAAAAPSDLLPAEYDFVSLSAFQVVGHQYAATLQMAPAPSGRAAVTLAEITVDVATAGETVVTARYDLLPADRDSCSVELPAGAQLISATIDGRAARVFPASNAARLRIAFEVERLPQRLELVYRGPLQPRSGQAAVEMSLPKFLDLPVERTLMTFADAAALSTECLPPLEAANEAEYILALREELVEIIERAAPFLSESGSGEIARWFLPWRRRHDRLLEASERLRQANPEAAETWRRRAEELQARYVAMFDRLGIASELSALADDAGAENALDGATAGAAIEGFGASPRRAVSRWMLPLEDDRGNPPAEAPTVAWRLPEPACASRGGGARPLLAAAFVLVAALAWLFARRNATPVAPRDDWQPLAGLAVGVVWFVLLAPSIVGLAIIAASLWRYWHPRWHYRPTAAHFSTTTGWTTNDSRRTK